MSNCAVIDLETNIVINKIVAEPIDLAPDGTYLILIADGVICDIGWIWNGLEFINPNPLVDFSAG